MERVVRDRRRRGGIREHKRLIALSAVLVALIIYWIFRSPSSTYYWKDTEGNVVFYLSRPNNWLESPTNALRPPPSWGIQDAIFARKQTLGFPPTIWIRVREVGKRDADYLLKAEKTRVEGLEKYKVISTSEIEVKGAKLKRTEYTYVSPFVGTRAGALDADTEQGFLCRAIGISTFKDGRLIKITGVTREKDFGDNREELEKCLLSVRFE